MQALEIRKFEIDLYWKRVKYLLGFYLCYFCWISLYTGIFRTVQANI